VSEESAADNAGTRTSPGAKGKNPPGTAGHQTQNRKRRLPEIRNVPPNPVSWEKSLAFSKAEKKTRATRNRENAHLCV
jgi:hypothetical protein